MPIPAALPFADTTLHEAQPLLANGTVQSPPEKGLLAERELNITHSSSTENFSKPTSSQLAYLEAMLKAATADAARCQAISKVSAPHETHSYGRT